ncbi:MAG: hypothetical protein RUMPE_00802 [Eubacteriales bacterium SKADARSKE-1]|nr:hypothetical protein [Eubacteriales bacterium SKADARSKE-1]
MSKDFYYSGLLDFYGELLNDRQREAMEYYYNEDLSLSEIADNFEISKQGVRDLIKRAEVQLKKTEEKLNLLEKSIKTRKKINDMLDTINEIEKQIQKDSDFKNVKKLIYKIKNIATILYEGN